MNETLVLDPWKYYIVKDCFPINEFEELHEQLGNIFIDVKDGNHVYDIHELHLFGLNDKCIDYLITHTEKLLSENLLQKFDYYQESKYGYFCIPRIGVSRNKRYGVHDDTTASGESNFKSLSYLVYMSPKHSTGTEFYMDKNFHSVADWKLNNGIYFCPEPNKTFHDFLSEGEIRITFNLNICQLEMLYETNILSELAKHDKDKLIYLFNIIKNNKLFRSSHDVIGLIESYINA